MERRKALLIINPIAGTSSKDGLDEFVSTRFQEAGWDVDVRFTKGHGDATTLAREGVDKGFEAVIAAGGDGTVNETARALCDTGVTLGIIPCGSGNGLARHLHIPVDMGEGLNVILQDHPRDIDYGMLGDRRFFCTCGMGFDASVSERFASKGTRGLSTYVKSVVEEFQSFKPAEYRITLEGEEVTESAFLIAVCNASQYGNNAYIAPEASIDDGLFDITVVHTGNVLRTTLVAFDLMNGNLNKNTLVTSFRAGSIKIERAQEGAIHIDGDPIRMEGPLEIVCHHKGLRVFTPTKEYHFTPFVSPAADFMRDFRLHIKHMMGIR